ncbi:Retrovirus-related Pol polyprotein from transposon RE1 [Bienertia sinuspersici]
MVVKEKTTIYVDEELGGLVAQFVKAQSMQISSMVFNGNNFLNWSRSVKMSFGSKNKLGYIDGSMREPERGSKDHSRWPPEIPREAVGSNGNKKDVELITSVVQKVMKAMNEKQARSVAGSSFAGSVLSSNINNVYDLVDEQTWIIDTGASDYIGAKINECETLKNLKGTINIGLPDGSLKKVDQVGIVKIMEGIQLKNVLYVPGFKHNLLSVSKLLENQHLEVISHNSDGIAPQQAKSDVLDEPTEVQEKFNEEEDHTTDDNVEQEPERRIEGAVQQTPELRRSERTRSIPKKYADYETHIIGKEKHNEESQSPGCAKKSDPTDPIRDPVDPIRKTGYPIQFLDGSSGRLGSGSAAANLLRVYWLAAARGRTVGGQRGNWAIAGDSPPRKKAAVGGLVELVLARERY